MDARCGFEGAGQALWVAASACAATCGVWRQNSASDLQICNFANLHQNYASDLGHVWNKHEKYIFSSV